MKEYTIGEAAKKVNLTSHTIRYYDKEGLLPFVQRTDSGIRVFTENDIEWLEIVNCLKSTKMPIKEIKKYTDWCVEGDSTLKKRYNMFLERKKVIESQIEELKNTLKRIDYKCWYYEKALEAGTIQVHEDARNYFLSKNNK